jgi:hypothetical protein
MEILDKARAGGSSCRAYTGASGDHGIAKL